MSDKQAKVNPKVEWGYFAVTPRILRTQYKQLSHTEKWLYTCLKDLCGDKGMCFRTLRVLSQETDLSIGNLSIGIRHLHEAGLIHAEKKRRSNNPTAKEVWHISIVDIWKSNVEYCSNYEHSAENVQEMNNNVQIMNNPPLERSFPEQKRSNFDDRRNNIEEQHFEERTVEEQVGVSADASTSHALFTQDLESLEDDPVEDDDPEATVKAPVTPKALKVVPEQTPSQARDGEHERNDGTATDGIGSEPRASGKDAKLRRGGKRTSKSVEEPLPLEVVQFLDAWDSLHRAPLPRTDRLIALAKAGITAKITREELEGCRNWLPTTDRPGKPYYRHKGVGLWDVIDKIGEYRSLQNMPIPGVPLADMKKDPDGPELGVSGLSKLHPRKPDYSAYQKKEPPHA